MKKVLTSKKLSRNNLKAIQGAGQMICCLVSCGDINQCIFWEQLPAECPEFPYCL